MISGPLPFLSDQWLLLLSAISLTIWKGLGYYMIIYLAALGNVGRELHEAAAVDGAGPFRRFMQRHHSGRTRHDDPDVDPGLGVARCGSSPSCTS